MRRAQTRFQCGAEACAEGPCLPRSSTCAGDRPFRTKQHGFLGYSSITTSMSISVCRSAGEALERWRIRHQLRAAPLSSTTDLTMAASEDHYYDWPASSKASTKWPWKTFLMVLNRSIPTSNGSPNVARNQTDSAEALTVSLGAENWHNWLLGESDTACVASVSMSKLMRLHCITCRISIYNATQAESENHNSLRPAAPQWLEFGTVRRLAKNLSSDV